MTSHIGVSIASVCACVCVYTYRDCVSMRDRGRGRDRIGKLVSAASSSWTARFSISLVTEQTLYYNISAADVKFYGRRHIIC